MTYSLGNKYFRNILFAAIVVLGVALSILVSSFSYYSDKKLIQAAFNEAAENRYSALKRELANNLAVLTSLQALYYSSGKYIERSEFRNFTNYILKQHPGIKALYWIPRVPASRREAFERGAKREGFPEFQFTERIAQGKMKREGNRKEYFPVYFIEPNTGNEIVLGYDLTSDPELLEALEVAGKTGETRATARIAPARDTLSQFGFIVFAPIYKKGASINSDQVRWDNLEGFALGTFRVSDIVKTAMHYFEPEGVDLFIYDTSAPEKKRFLYAYSSRTRKTPLLNQDHPETNTISSKTLEFAGRKWTVIYSAAPDFITARMSWRPWGLLFAGLIFSGLFAGLLFSIGSYAERADKWAKHLSVLNTNLVREIVDRKSAEDELRESEERLSMALKAPGQSIYDSDLKTGEAIVSPEYALLLGCNPAEFHETTAEWFKRLHPDDKEQVAAVYRAYVKGEIPEYKVEFRQKTKDGSWKWILSVAKITERDADGNPLRMTGTHTDITEHKKLEEQLLQSQKMEAIGLLAGGVAHDFNNILTAIIGFGTIAKKRLQEDIKTKGFVEEMIAGARHAAELTRGLLAFSRKQVICPKLQNLNEIVGNMEKMLRRIIIENIELRTVLSERDIIVMVDAVQMGQVLLNLTTNARDAMHEGGHLFIETDVVNIDNGYAAANLFEKSGEYALLTVSDTGTGMDLETRENIFEPFFTTKEVGKGTGLGLAMVYGIVKQHDGNITVHSEPGKGTTFKIYLPMLQAENEGAEEHASSVPQGKGETILIAEDDAAVRRILRITLEEHGYEVVEAVNGQEAVRNFEANIDKVSMVILDVIMPVKNGRDAYESIKKLNPDIKAIFMSGYTDDIIVKNGIMEDGFDFITKPINPQALMRKIGGMLNR